MKKKSVEHLPYIEPPKAGKEYGYIAALRKIELKEEEHLIVDVYGNAQNARKGMPILRIAATKISWGIYYPGETKWSESILKNNIGWDYGERIKNSRKIATYMQEESEKEILSWCKENGVVSWKDDTWAERLNDYSRNIRRLKESKRWECRKKRLKERIENTAELPEDLEEWADRKLFAGEHYLYYKRHGRYTDVCCSKCGKVTTAVIKKRDTYEGLFEKVIEPPLNNGRGICPSCRCSGIWKAQGRTKGVWAQTKYCFIGMTYKGTGAVIRYVGCEKQYRMNAEFTEAGMEMESAEERLIITEIARRYLKKGEKPQTDYHKYSGWSGENLWDDCNLSGMSNIYVNPAVVYDKTWEMLKGTDLQYSGAEEYAKAVGKIQLMDYMESYLQYPQMEMLSKLGMIGVVERMLRCTHPSIVDRNAINPEGFLRIYKSRIKLMIEKKGNIRCLEALQTEKRLEAHWSDEELQMVIETEMGRDSLELAMEYMSMKQLCNRLEKYSGVSLKGGGTLCGGAAGRLRTVTRLYFDYLNMRRQQGYDLHNTVFLWPRNLQQAHDQMVQEVNAKQIEKRNRETAERYKEIRKRYRGLRKRYYYEDEEYLIRPARSAEEIVREGRELHHCVGGDNYLRKHSNGESAILFLRIKTMPEVPYITVEIKDSQIQQWHGAYDRKPDQERIQEWLDAYLLHLRDEQQEKRVMAAG